MFFPATVQAVVALLQAGAFAVLVSPAAAGAALYGALAALGNTALLVWRWRRGEQDHHCDGPRHLKTFYRSSMERFLVVGVWLAIGLGGFKLDAGPVLTGFVVVLLAWVIAAAARK